MIEWIQTNWLELFAAVTGVVTVASIIVKLTPTPKDDAILAKVIAFLKVIGLQKKDK